MTQQRHPNRIKKDIRNRASDVKKLHAKIETADTYVKAHLRNIITGLEKEMYELESELFGTWAPMAHVKRRAEAKVGKG